MSLPAGGRKSPGPPHIFSVITEQPLIHRTAFRSTVSPIEIRMDFVSVLIFAPPPQRLQHGRHNRVLARL